MATISASTSKAYKGCVHTVLYETRRIPDMAGEGNCFMTIGKYSISYHYQQWKRTFEHFNQFRTTLHLLEYQTLCHKTFFEDWALVVTPVSLWSGVVVGVDARAGGAAGGVAVLCG